MMSKAFKPGSWAFVTGGSDGLGLALAEEVAARGLNCLLIARREGVLAAAAAKLARHNVEIRTLSLDLEAADAVERLAFATRDLPLTLAVFNAGAEASGDEFTAGDWEAWHSVIQRNIIFLTQALHYFGQRLRSTGGGGILVVGSEAAFGGVARTAVYSATKGYALNLCEALWAELEPHGVDVTTLLFGIADTPTLRRALARKGISIKTVNAVDPEKLARAAVTALGTGPVFNFDEADPDNSLTSAARRRERVVSKSEMMKLFYG
jgi:uncharacterized protein